MKKKLILSFMIVSLLSISMFSYTTIKKVNADDDLLSNELEKSTLKKLKTYSESFESENKYYTVYNNWLTEGFVDGEDRHLISPDKFTLVESEINEENKAGLLLAASESYGYNEAVAYLTHGSSAEFEVNINDGGLYQIYFDYYILSETKLTPSMTLSINEMIQYNEMINLEIPINWKLEKETKYDRYGDELTPKSELQLGWIYEQGINDPAFFFEESLKFSLNKGLNKIKITINEGYILLGNIRIEAREVNIPNYADYQLTHENLTGNIESLIPIEAEDLSFKSRQSIRAKYMRDPKVTPYEYKNRVINVLDGYSFGEAGDSVTYEFNISESGFYQMAFKYYLNTNDGLPSHRGILIDGEYPFKELTHYTFKYQSNWKNEVISNEFGSPFEIFLEEGTHTLSLIVDNVKVREIYNSLLIILDDIEQISSDINKITGGLQDRERNWKITTYVPHLVPTLQDISERLGLTIDALKEYANKEDLPTISHLKIAQKLMNEFIKEPDELPGYMTKFSVGESSAYGRINRVLPLLIYSPLHLDKIYFYNNVDLPKANANIFVKLFEGVKSFFYSFLDPKYNNINEVDDDTIVIWVNKSRLYVEIMQKMIDEEFTPKTGIKVQLSLLPDENKIVLSNAAGTTPDGVIGVSHGKPFELSIRGVIEDLREYEGFYDLAEEFNSSTFIPYIYEDGVYAIPETQDVKLLFYRKDILAQLGVEPPQTWEEVVSLIPILQKYDMNFYIPLGSDSSFKGFDSTTPFIYQHGGLLYDEKTMTTVINKNGAYEGFELMTDLYTVYNLPVTTSNFYQHFRNGNIPLGISDANMYIQLKYAAPELSGQWSMMPIPGVFSDESGEIERWDPTYGASSIIFKNATDINKDRAWELIKWWSGSETQTDFSYEIQATLGNRFLYMSANIDGFKNGAWPSDSKQVVLEQWKWIQATGKVPGDYMIEREISNAWNKIVFGGENPRVAIDTSITIINRELQRKLQEFGYVDEDGMIIKAYKVPTIYNVESWVRKDEEE